MFDDFSSTFKLNLTSIKKNINLLLIMDVSGQLTFEDSPLILKFNKVVTYIRNAEFNKALEIMEEILKINSEFPGLVESIKSIKFWQNRWLKILRTPQGKEQADILLDEWVNYENFSKSFSNQPEKIFIVIKNLIYKKILKNLIYAFQNSEVPNVELLKKIGEIFLEIDENQKAIETLEYARMFRKKDSYLLALLAESYSREGNIQKAKSLFREAFLYNPQEIDLSLIKSELILEIVKTIKSKGIDEKMLLEWIPVYGAILNIFNIKREISYEELVRLTQEAEELEKEYYNRQFTNEFIEPKLINRYLWLIDYYRLQSPNKEYTKIYLNKLKELNPKIYEQYSTIINLNNN